MIHLFQGLLVATIFCFFNGEVREITFTATKSPFSCLSINPPWLPSRPHAFLSRFMIRHTIKSPKLCYKISSPSCKVSVKRWIIKDFGWCPYVQIYESLCRAVELLIQVQMSSVFFQVAALWAPQRLHRHIYYGVWN